MKTKAKAIVLSIGLALAQPATAVDIVFDPNNMAQNIQQVAQLAEQLAQLKSIYDTAVDTLQSLSGSHGYGGLMPNATAMLRNQLPPEWNRVYSDAVSAGSIFDGQARGLLGQFDSQIRGMGRFEALQYVDQRLREKAAYDRVMFEQTYNNQMAEMQTIEELESRIREAPTAKDVMDLQARIQTAQASIQAQQARLTMMAQLAEAQEKLLQEQKRLALRRYVFGEPGEPIRAPNILN